ncbi:dynein axonemal assembly factor 6 isoform X2 [Ranitomeya variabilis]|uniref:dynein axonemal assembly factor 6 isoform X2 n=1 Tax=Ranitomeya variabilis TaxID=490064 RepID=UPI0040572492
MRPVIPEGSVSSNLPVPSDPAETVLFIILSGQVLLVMDHRHVNFSSPLSIEALCELLNNSEDDIESLSASSGMNPGNIGPVEPENKAAASLQKDKSSKAIWSVSEVPDGSQFDDSLDPRKQPKYEMHFKQRVGSEDLFMGLSRKNPSTACCEDLVVKIHLPNTRASDMSLDITRKFLDLRTPKYKLGLHLPHPVNEKSGKAQFKVDTETLEVTLTMVRDLDFVNFS